MPFRQLSLIIIVLTGFTAVGYWAYVAENPNKITTRTQSAETSAPDFFAKNVRMKDFGPEGTLEMTLDSREINHYPHNKTTVLTQPLLWSYRENREPWSTTADSGRILSDGETVELIDNVIMKQKAPNGQDGQRMDTDFLTVYSGQDYADTNSPVRLTSPGNIVTAVGMRTFYKQDHIQFKSKVRSIHESR